jgi:predicted TIM-barrel fold metal-dependent hydrolase
MTSSFHPTRRAACCGIAGLFATLLGSGGVAAQPSPGRRVDLHHHFLPPEYVAQMGAERIGRPAPNGQVPRWSVAQSLETMDRLGIARAVLSISAPGVWTGDAAASAKLARDTNTYAARVVAEHPGRFGFFASLPLPDVPAALAELDHALDTLKADGVVLMTNYAGRYLGDPAFAPLFEALDRRGALVFVHPTECDCAGTGVPASVVDFPQDTTRSITSLLYSGTLARHRRIRFVLSHAGGTLPYLAARIAGAAAFVPGVPKEAAANALAHLQALYYDTALSVNPTTMTALLKFVPPRQVVLGTDYPFAPAPMLGAALQGLGQLGLTADELAQLEGGSARALLGREAA